MTDPDNVTSVRYSNVMTGFTKLFQSIVHSTIWREPMHVKVVWVTMLAMADRDGGVSLSIPGLADLSKVSLDECLDALERLKAPDEWSRTKEHEGRRIEDVDGGWVILNYLKYRNLMNRDDQRIKTRDRVRSGAVVSVAAVHEVGVLFVIRVREVLLHELDVPHGASVDGPLHDHPDLIVVAIRRGDGSDGFDHSIP